MRGGEWDLKRRRPQAQSPGGGGRSLQWGFMLVGVGILLLLGLQSSISRDHNLREDCREWFGGGSSSDSANTITLPGRSGQGGGGIFAPQLDLGAFLEEAKAHLKLEGLAGECAAHFGEGFVNEWRQTRMPYCLAPPGEEAVSQVMCWPRPNTAPPQQLCQTHNGVMSFPLVLDHGLSSWAAGCTTNASAWNASAPEAAKGPIKVKEQEWNGIAKRWFKDGFAEGKYDTVADSCGNGTTVVDHPVFFIERWDPTNVYHFLEDTLMAWASLLVAYGPSMQKEVLAKGVEFVFMDKMREGHYVEVWRRFGHPQPPRFIRKRPFPDGTCFKTALHNVHAGTSMFSPLVGRPSTCPSLMVQALSCWFRHLFHDAIRDPCFEVAPPQQLPAALQPLPATLQAAHVIPEKEHKQNEGIRDHTVLWVSRAKFEHTHHLSHWQAPRRLHNEAEVITKLQTTVLAWNDQTCMMQADDPNGDAKHNTTRCRPGRTFFRLQTVELSDHSFIEQLSITSKVSVYMGVHGAGMAQVLFMKPNRGAVVELRVGPTVNSYHYHNIAHWNGQHYRAVNSPDGHINVEHVEQALKLALDYIAQRDWAETHSASEKYPEVWVAGV